MYTVYRGDLPPGHGSNEQKVFASFFKKKCFLLFLFEKRTKIFCSFLFVNISR